MEVDTTHSGGGVVHGNLGVALVAPDILPRVTDDPVRRRVRVVVADNDDAVVVLGGAVLDVDDATSAEVLESLIGGVDTAGDGLAVHSGHHGVVFSRDMDEVLNLDILGFISVVFAITCLNWIEIRVRVRGHRFLRHEPPVGKTLHATSTSLATRVAVNLLLLG